MATTKHSTRFEVCRLLQRYVRCHQWAGTEDVVSMNSIALLPVLSGLPTLPSDIYIDRTSNTLGPKVFDTLSVDETHRMWNCSISLGASLDNVARQHCAADVENGANTKQNVGVVFILVLSSNSVA